MKETTASNPTPDITSVDINCQISVQLETALHICDHGIHHKQFKNAREYEEFLWTIRLLVESALYKFEIIRA